MDLRATPTGLDHGGKDGGLPRPFVEGLRFTAWRCRCHTTAMGRPSTDCMQCTTRLGPPLHAMSRPGLATDVQLARVGEVCGPVVALRVVLPAVGGACGCGCAVGAGPSFVAVDPSDGAVPDGQRAAVARVAPGRAVADTGWAFLAGGTVALVGLDVVVVETAELGPGDGPGPVLLALSDLAVSLSRTTGEHVPLLRTLVVVEGVGDDDVTLAGWDVEPTWGGAVPVATGLGTSDLHRAGRRLRSTASAIG